MRKMFAILFTLLAVSAFTGEAEAQIVGFTQKFPGGFGR